MCSLTASLMELCMHLSLDFIPYLHLELLTVAII